MADSKEEYLLELTSLQGKVGRYDLGATETHICCFTEDMLAPPKLHEEIGVICYENEAMGLYFINHPDGYWLELVPDMTAKS